MPRTVLFAWELGGGLGHLAPVVPLFAGLRERGYRVVLAARDVSRARPLLGGCGIELLQAPIKTNKAGERVDPLRSFGHILFNCGLADFEESAALAEAWRNLLVLVRPDLVLCDHAPVALVAARALSTTCATIGTGFCCPPDVYPMPDFRPWLPNAEEAIRRDEDRVTRNVNRLLEEWNCDPIDRLGQLYSGVDECFLTTFPELDHYPQRENGRYWGPLGLPMGETPVWPEAEGKKVFAYLKLTKDLPGILRALQDHQLCSLVYVERLPFRFKVHYQSDRLRFASGPVDLEAVGRACDLAILNGGHGSTAAMLRFGCPILQVPMNLEQALTGLAVERMQAGLCVDPERPSEAPRKLRALLVGDEFKAGAARFAENHRDFDPAGQIELLVKRVGELAESPSSSANRSGEDRAGNNTQAASIAGARACESRARNRSRRCLPADLAAVSVFFNPVGYRSTVENFRKYYRCMREQGIELHAVEIAFGNGPFHLADLPGVQQVRTSDVMWQLERMINHTIAGLSDRFTKVIWIDTDVFFENPGWFRDTSEALDHHLVVQPFHDAVWLKADGGELRRRQGMVSAMRDYPEQLGDPTKMHPGFAWAARRELISKHGVPDFCLVGGNDRVFANAIYNLEWAEEMSYFPMGLQRRIRAWKTGFAADVDARATWIDGTVYHLWHGEIVNRLYKARNIPLLNYNYDPAVDVKIGADGAWHWTTDKPGLHEEVRAYFHARRSDG